MELLFPEGLTVVVELLELDGLEVTTVLPEEGRVDELTPGLVFTELLFGRVAVDCDDDGFLLDRKSVV